MNQSTKRALFSILTVIFLLAGCAPAPAPATQDPRELQQLIEQSVAKALNTQNAQATEPQAQIAAQATLTPTASPFVLTPQPTESILTATAPFDPNAPTVQSISPNTGFTTVRTTVTITGTNFIVGKGTIRFYFGDKEAKEVICKSTTECTAITPSGVEGDVTVKAVLAGDGPAEDSMSDTFTFTVLDPDAPVINSIAPPEGPTRGGIVVTINGMNFIRGRGEGATKFFFGEYQATDVICEIDIECKVRVPQGQEGIVLVTAQNGDIKSQHIPGNELDGFKYNGIPKYGCGVLTTTPKNLSVFRGKETFVIKWIFKNTGENTWPAGLDVKFSSGVNMSGRTAIEIPVMMKPNDTYAIKIDAVAPSNPGTYYMSWIVEGMGCDAYVAITVE